MHNIPSYGCCWPSFQNILSVLPAVGRCWLPILDTDVFYRSRGTFRFSLTSPGQQSSAFTYRATGDARRVSQSLKFIQPWPLWSSQCRLGWCFNNVHICLLEWAQVNNLIWRGRPEIPIKVPRISDFIQSERFHFENLFFFFVSHSTCVITTSTVPPRQAEEKITQLSDTQRGGVWLALSAYSASWRSQGLSWKQRAWPTVHMQCGTNIHPYLSDQFKLLVHLVNVSESSCRHWT